MTRDDLTHLTPQDLLTLLAFGEARGESVEGQLAVLRVVANRLTDPHKAYGASWHEVALRPWQFSCFNASDPNLALLLTMADALDSLHASDAQPFRQIAWLAAGVVRGVFIDNVHGANHYCTVAASPYWAADKLPVAKIGRHVFFRL